MTTKTMKEKYIIVNEKMRKALDEFIQLRNDDEDFAEQWDDTKKDFLEWYEDNYKLNTKV